MHQARAGSLAGAVILMPACSGAFTGTGFSRGRAQCLVHDSADGARAPPALRRAAETAVDLIGGGGTRRRSVEGRTNITIAEDVAGTNDHDKRTGLLARDALDVGHPHLGGKKKSALWTDSKVLICLGLIALLLPRYGMPQSLKRF